MIAALSPAERDSTSVPQLTPPGEFLPSRTNNASLPSLSAGTTAPELTTEQQAHLRELRAKEPWRKVVASPLADNVSTTATTTTTTTSSAYSTSLSDSVTYRPHDGEEEVEIDSPSPSTTPSPTKDESPLSPEWQAHFQEFCSDACLLRYLRARSWNVQHALEALVDTLQWRYEYRPHRIDPESLRDESSTGKEYINGFDRYGRPILYFRNHRENTKNYDSQIRLLVLNLETAIRLMPAGVEKVVLIFDFSQFSPSCSPPMHINKQFLSLLSAHYPERLGAWYACNAPWYF